MRHKPLVRLALLASVALTATTASAVFTNVGPSVLGVNLDARSASLGDYDDDGDLDLLYQGAFGSQKLYRNNRVGIGTLGFTDVSTQLPSGLGASWSAAWGDYDGDGRVDVFVGQSNVSASEPGRTGDVLRNTGAGFANTSAATGLADPGFHQNVAWADIDNDRDLDLLIAMEGPERHEIYLQGPGQQFTSAAVAAGFQIDFGTKAYGMAIGDTDSDGDLDVYLSTCIGNNFIRNNFFRNNLVETGSLTFTDIADTNGTQFMQNSYGAEFHDFDDDGDLDLFMVGADREPSKLFRNNGGNQFTDVATITGQPLLSDVAGDLNGGRAVDYDNDGDLDLFFHDHKPGGTSDQARKLYRNDGNWTFTDVTTAQGLAAVNQGSYDSPWGDLDLDGDMDLVATTDASWNERVFLSDASGNGNHWLHVRLEGPTDNTTGIGAELYATVHDGAPGERRLRREANTNAGTFNQSDLPVHFGLGAATLVDELVIRWRDGAVQVLRDVAVDRYLTVARASLLAGDFNGDGVVDALDYTVWRDGLGKFFRASDYAAWAANYGATAAVSAPEPGAMGLAMTAILLGSIPRVMSRSVSRR